MSSFDDRLNQAIERGTQRGHKTRNEESSDALDESDLKNLHSKYRLQLSEHIEACLKKLTGHFPGFDFETLFGERGWGAACSRDDLNITRGKRENIFSRLEMTVRPLTDFYVLDLAAKGTIRNKEVFNRNHFEKIADVDPNTFVDLIDTWVVEYAEIFAAQ